MNNVFLRDRMERNNSDFEGSGIGEGRFDEYEEEKAKFSDAISSIPSCSLSSSFSTKL